MTLEERMVDTVLRSWGQVMGQVDGTVASFSDEDFEKQVAPGRNRVRYLVGHLAVVSDMMLPMLRLGERKLAGWDQEFLKNPDGAVAAGPTVAEIRAGWAEASARLLEALRALTPEEWMERHSALSEEEFVKEPHRNRLALVLSRLTHAAMHEGQLRLAKAK